MGSIWFYSDMLTNRIGPCSGQQLKDLAASGQLLPTDTIWKEGTERGVVASKVKNLFQPVPVCQLGMNAVVANPQVVAKLDPDPAGKIPEAVLPGVAAMALVTLLPLDPVSVLNDTAKKPEAERPIPPAPKPQAHQNRKARAVAGKGTVIVGQDGVTVKFRKKCTTCGHADSSWTTIPIKNGVTRAGYFCPKCRKHREAEIHGYPS